LDNLKQVNGRLRRDLIVE